MRNKTCLVQVRIINLTNLPLPSNPESLRRDLLPHSYMAHMPRFRGWRCNDREVDGMAAFRIYSRTGKVIPLNVVRIVPGSHSLLPN